jgi:hypothetical protein
MEPVGLDGSMSTTVERITNTDYRNAIPAQQRAIAERVRRQEIAELNDECRDLATETLDADGSTIENKLAAAQVLATLALRDEVADLYKILI